MSFLGRDNREATERPDGQTSNPLARRLANAAATPLANAPTPAAQPAPAATASTPAAQATAAAPSQARTIGRLQRVPAEELWGSDAGQVVTWLRSNLDPLGEAIGLDLVPAATPQVPGSTNAFLATVKGGQPAIVVVELGTSTDDRFGVLLRQMVASAAKTAIWITGEPRPDHTASVSWLNRAVDGRFYVVHLEAAKIGDSAAAPVFTAAVRPPRATDAVEDAPRPTGSVPDGQTGRRAEDWVETARVEEVSA